MLHIVLRKTIVHANLVDTVDLENVYYRTQISYSLKLACKKVSYQFYRSIWEPHSGVRRPRIAGGLRRSLQNGLVILHKKRSYINSFIPTSTFSGYEDLLRFVRDYIQACEKFPKANIIIYEMSKPKM